MLLYHYKLLNSGSQTRKRLSFDSCEDAQHNHRVKPNAELLIRDIPTFCRDCPKDYKNYGFDCYYFAPGENYKNIKVGIDNCRNTELFHGGELFVPNSPEEAEFMATEVKEHGGVRNTCILLHIY